MLPLYWINKRDLAKFDDNLLENYSSIDSASLGGTNSIPNKVHYDSDRLANYLGSIASSKQRKVINFVNDYLEALIKWRTC